MKNQENTYSISLRIQRVTYEDAYLSIPVTELITSEKEDGSIGIDFDKLVQEAIKISSDERVDWQMEKGTIGAHEIQNQAPEGRAQFNPLLAE